MSVFQQSPYRLAKHLFWVICIALLLSTMSCSSANKRSMLAPESLESIEQLFASNGKNQLHEGEWRWISLPPANFVSPTGLREEVKAASGERLEVRWEVDWLGSGKIFPRWYYELRYFGADCHRSHCEGVQAGRCHFAQGCNFIRYYVVDANHDGIPDRFLLTSWESWDYGGDEGVEGFLDQVEHRYDPVTGRYGVMKRLYRYPPGCEPPVSSPPHVCDLKEECRPPYALVKEEVMQSRP